MAESDLEMVREEDRSTIRETFQKWLDVSHSTSTTKKRASQQRRQHHDASTADRPVHRALRYASLPRLHSIRNDCRAAVVPQVDCRRLTPAVQIL